MPSVRILKTPFTFSILKYVQSLEGDRTDKTGELNSEFNPELDWAGVAQKMRDSEQTINQRSAPLIITVWRFIKWIIFTFVFKNES